MNRFASTTVNRWRRRTRSACRIAVLASVCATPLAWGVPTVTFVATDLADTTAGQDLWQYDYTISGPIDAFAGLNLLFAATTYASLTVTSNDAALDVLATQPDPTLPADGLVGVTALTPLSATASAQVGVSFVWIGTHAPGSQPFEIVDDQFNVVGTGRSVSAVSAVPEPATTALLLAGLAVLAPIAGRRRHGH